MRTNLYVSCFCPNPGSRVYVPYLKFLEDIFNRGIKGKPYKKPIYLGKSEIVAASAEAFDQTDFYLDGAELATNNTLICAVDGIGKTHAAAVIAEELANKTNDQIVIVDPNGEYTTIGLLQNLIKSTILVSKRQ